MCVHFIVRFEPAGGKEGAFREELLRVVEPTRAESGCRAIRVFESLREPRSFAIHSEWTDEAAFERQAGLPHTVRLRQAADPGRCSQRGDPGVVSISPVSSSVLRPERIIGQPP